MSFPSESSTDPFGGPPNAVHQLRKGSEPISNPSPGPASGAPKIQTYGEMTTIPTSLYNTVMETIKQHLQNKEQNLSMQHIEEARKNVNNPNKYRYHMTEANRYRTVAQSKNINDMIRQKVTDSGVDRIKSEIDRLKSGKLTSPGAMSKLRQLQIEYNQRKDILMQKETQSYNQYITNPFNSLPKTMPQNSSQQKISDFLKQHPGTITSNREGHLIIDGQKISENPHDVASLMHYLTTDISGTPPTGTAKMLSALSKRGFDVNNHLGNTFLKQKLDEMRANLIKKRQDALQAKAATEKRPTLTPSKVKLPTWSEGAKAQRPGKVPTTTPLTRQTRRSSSRYRPYKRRSDRYSKDSGVGDDNDYGWSDADSDVDSDIDESATPKRTTTPKKATPKKKRSRTAPSSATPAKTRKPRKRKEK
eukprot:Seg4081.5 transcript_id=Seg4081.5/GoldUCD/mRNA.D3Y31 product="hypothetical protein" protein_id=Seg4081.5/GoldUCD/D3Y31